MSLANTGEVFVFGDNTYGQHGVEDKKGSKYGLKNSGTSFYGDFAKMSIINLKNIEQVDYIACGGDHIFVRTILDEIYGWGRNDEGQLGVGFLTEKVTTPTIIKDLSYRGIK